MSRSTPSSLNLDLEFQQRIRSIHGLDGSPTLDAIEQEAGVDTRKLELDAMIDVYLGAETDPTIRNELDRIHSEMRELQFDLIRHLDAGDISESAYVERSNALHARSMERFQQVLGTKNLEKLFGSSDSTDGFIDRVESRTASDESFVTSTDDRKDELRTATRNA